MAAKKNEYCGIPLTYERLLQVIKYNPDNGNFHRIIQASNRLAGLHISSPNISGYLRMRIDGKSYYAHRLAWFYAYGYMPIICIDHINGIKIDNSIANLRECSIAENSQNISAKTKAKSGLRGAYFNHKIGKWQSKIESSGTKISLGYFLTAELAHAAYVQKKKEIHTFNPELTR